MRVLLISPPRAPSRANLCGNYEIRMQDYIVNIREAKCNTRCDRVWGCSKHYILRSQILSLTGQHADENKFITDGMERKRVALIWIWLMVMVSSLLFSPPRPQLPLTRLFIMYSCPSAKLRNVPNWHDHIESCQLCSSVRVISRQTVPGAYNRSSTCS